MDALAEMLRAIRVDSAIYLHGLFSEPWCMATPEMKELAPIFQSPSQHIIIYHFLCEGRAYCAVEEDEPVALSEGEIVVLPHGNRHKMGGGVCATPVDAAAALPGVLAKGLELITMGGGGPPAKFICGYLACDPQLSPAFLGGLPPLIRLNIRDDASGQWLENSLRFSVSQAAARTPGTTEMLSKLSEVFFAEVIRRYQRELPPDQKGWLAGARDPGVGKALTLLHHRSTHAWTIAELAREVGLSRTVLAERFRRFIGESPMGYLMRWRLRLGARALVSTNSSVGQIAFDVGYESEAAFNRAFKREYGVPPARYRRGTDGPTVHSASA